MQKEKSRVAITRAHCVLVCKPSASLIHVQKCVCASLQRVSFMYRKYIVIISLKVRAKMEENFHYSKIGFQRVHGQI